MNSMLLMILLITIVDSTLSATEISMLPEKDTFYVIEGENVTLICVTTELNGKPVRWDHNGELIANVAPPANPIYTDPSDSSKYLVEGAGREGGNFTFTVLNYGNDDSGLVTCGVRGVESVRFKLETFVAPEDVFMTVVSSHRMADGTGEIRLPIDSPSFIACSAVNSKPAAVIRWLWNGNENLEDYLNITNAVQNTGGLSNVTSTIILTPDLFFSTDAHDDSAETTDNLTILEITDGDEFNEYTALSHTGVPDVMTITKYGELTCEANIGDRMYTESIVVDFTNANAGIQTERTLLLLLIPFIAFHFVLY